MKKTDLVENGTERMDTGDSRFYTPIANRREQSLTVSVNKSLRRMLRMMAVVLTELMTITACITEDDDVIGDDDDGGNGGGNNSYYAEKAAVKYLQVHMLPAYDGFPLHTYVIYDNYGKRYREDWMGPIKERDSDNYISLYDLWETNIENHITKTNWRRIYHGEWENLQYKTEKTLEIAWLGSEIIFTDRFTKQSGQMTFAGKSCDVYSLTHSIGGENVTHTYAIWNKITMMHEVKISPSGEILARIEAVAISLDVPEVAFTKTYNITWLPQ